VKPLLTSKMPSVSMILNHWFGVNIEPMPPGDAALGK